MPNSALTDRPRALPVSLVLTVLLVALLAEGVEQVFHEAVHAVAALAVGARLEGFQLWAVLHGWPQGEGTAWREGIIAGSAALLDIVLAVACMLAFRRMQSRPVLRLFVFYLGAYSLFSGFGYLLVDPLFASESSVGDWAKVTMLLGGSWAVRVPIILVGAAGTVYGYFWMGRAAERFLWVDAADASARRRAGLVLCVAPYLFVNLVFSLLTFEHPVGVEGMVATLLKFWLGFGGFVWAYLIVFQWSAYAGPYPDASPLTNRLSPALPLLALAWLALVLLVLLPGVYPGWSW